MRGAVRVLARPEVAAGFSLAGLAPVETATPEAARDRLGDLLAEPGVGVVLLEDRFYDVLPPELQRQLSRRPLPMVIPFPGPAWVERRAEAEGYIVELLRQVIGYRVKLR